MSAARGRGAKVAKVTAKRAVAKRATAKRPAAKRPAAKASTKRVATGAVKGAAKRTAAKAVPKGTPSGRGGVRVWGNNHPAALLTERQVIRFRRLVRTGKATVGEIAAQEGCGHARISMAVRGETWAHLNDVAPPVAGGSRGAR